MATDNEVQITGGFDADEIFDGIRDVTDAFNDLPVAFDRVDDFFNAVSRGDMFDAIIEAFRVAKDIVEETNTALKTTIDSHNELTSAYEKYLRLREKGGVQDNIGGTGNSKRDELLKELGAEEMGFAAKGTILRWLENIGAAVTDVVEGGDLEGNMIAAGRDSQTAKATEEKLRKEKEAAEIEKQNKEMDAGQRRLDVEQSKQDMQQYYANKRQEEEQQKAVDDAAMARGREYLSLREELGRFDEADARRKMQQERQDALKALSRDKDGDKGFTSSIESFDSMYKRIQEAAGGTADDATERNNKNREEVARKQDELRAQWRKEDEAARAVEREDLAKKIAAVVGMK